MTPSGALREALPVCCTRCVTAILMPAYAFGLLRNRGILPTHGRKDFPDAGVTISGSG
jgi:hypothetical protein